MKLDEDRMRLGEVTERWVNILCLSEANPHLRAFLRNRHKSSTVKIVDDCAIGTSDSGDKVPGTDGEVDLYMAGPNCQPFSKMGKNEGHADERSETLCDAICFIVKRKPNTFILELVPNIKCKTHKAFLNNIIKKLR